MNEKEERYNTESILIQRNFRSNEYGAVIGGYYLIALYKEEYIIMKNRIKDGCNIGLFKGRMKHHAFI